MKSVAISYFLERKELIHNLFAHLTSATWRVRQREIFQLRIWDQREMSLTFSLETSLKFNLRSDTNIMEITSKFVIKYRTKLSTGT